MITNYNNHFFYSPELEDDFELIADPRDFQVPYGADQQFMCGEIELEELINRYQNLSNKTNHVMRNMLNGKEYGNRYVL